MKRGFEGAPESTTFRFVPDDAPEAAREDRAATYREVIARIGLLLEGETDWVAAMATIVCELHGTFGHYDWTGFYRVVGDELVIGPYQGAHGCVRIARRNMPRGGEDEAEGQFGGVGARPTAARVADGDAARHHRLGVDRRGPRAGQPEHAQLVEAAYERGGEGRPLAHRQHDVELGKLPRDVVRPAEGRVEERHVGASLQGRPVGAVARQALPIVENRYPGHDHTVLPSA
jgi:hypothetical protein